MGDITGQIAATTAAFARVLDDDGLVIRPVRVVCDGDHVVVESMTDARLRSGEEYRNTIIQWMTFSGSEIAKVSEYLDGAYSQQILGPALAAAFAEMQPPAGG